MIAGGITTHSVNFSWMKWMTGWLRHWMDRAVAWTPPGSTDVHSNLLLIPEIVHVLHSFHGLWTALMLIVWMVWTVMAEWRMVDIWSKVFTCFSPPLELFSPLFGAFFFISLLLCLLLYFLSLLARLWVLSLDDQPTSFSSAGWSGAKLGTVNVTIVIQLYQTLVYNKYITWILFKAVEVFWSC